MYKNSREKEEGGIILVNTKLNMNCGLLNLNTVTGCDSSAVENVLCDFIGHCK